MRAAECVLVVDDDKEIRESLVELLSESGCRALGAENGRVALEMLEKMHREQACLILLDLMMPVMDGVGFREEQMKRTELANIPVVVISAFEEVAEMKADAYMKKPLQLDDIIATAKRYCVCDA